ncbi:uncharacterized protein SAPINGB_P006060 [Magnusiomyces paraingens]|uniref:Acetate transporter n=1 Tax=Magnusiomyces paraingens TaxID=2606893 RepID=A0A5E8CA77_9ASCO|nr:uncharacterized protein SAPINGB_P006060 [Saprochaete ingens]VVT58146.1 unnamed protein product [Saprochaete ingens]
MSDEKPSSSTEEFHPNPNPHHDFIATSQGLSRVITSDTHVHLGSMSFERSEFMRAFEGYLNPGSAPRPSRKFGNPVPLGVAGFSMSLFIVSLINTGARDVSNGALAAGLCMVYSGLIELIAGIWCIVAENTWAATLITSFSGFWISYGFILIDAFGMVSAYKDTPGQLQSVLGFYLVGWTLFSAVMWSFTFRSTWVLFSLMFFVVIILCLLSAGQFLLLSHPTTATNCTKAGGVIGVFTAFIGWYIVYEGIATNENTFFVPPVLLMPQTVLGRKKKSQEEEV